MSNQELVRIDDANMTVGSDILGGVSEPLMTLSRRYMLELRRSALALVDTLEHALGYQPTTHDLRQAHRKTHCNHNTQGMET